VYFNVVKFCSEIFGGLEVVGNIILKLTWKKWKCVYEHSSTVSRKNPVVVSY
jgi:hypothetical protein